jgi:heme exporter protein D
VPEFQFDGLQDFLNMGGYAWYVWVSYSAFMLVLVWSLIMPRVTRRKLLQLHKARMQRETRLKSQRITEQRS